MRLDVKGPLTDTALEGFCMCSQPAANAYWCRFNQECNLDYFISMAGQGF